jgi:hypothetical protein
MWTVLKGKPRPEMRYWIVDCCPMIEVHECDECGKAIGPDKAYVEVDIANGQL